MKKKYVVIDVYPKGAKSVYGMKVGDTFTMDLDAPKPKPMHVWILEFCAANGVAYPVEMFLTREEARREKAFRTQNAYMGSYRVRKYTR